jgi:hypothetical protein
MARAAALKWCVSSFFCFFFKSFEYHRNEIEKHSYAAQWDQHDAYKCRHVANLEFGVQKVVFWELRAKTCDCAVQSWLFKYGGRERFLEAAPLPRLCKRG